MFFCKFWSKNYTVGPILSFRGFSITYHQKFILSISSTLWKFGSGHGDYISVIKYNTGWPILSFQKNLINFYKKHTWFDLRCIFPTSLANSDQEALRFDPNCHFKDSIKFSLKAHAFFSISKLFKKLNLGHYSLTHIVLSRILYKFPPKALNLLVLKSVL